MAFCCRSPAFRFARRRSTMASPPLPLRSKSGPTSTSGATRWKRWGFAVGPWLGAFKEAILRGSPEDTPIEVAWAGARGERPESLPLGALKQEIMRITAGRKIAYVVDCAFTEANVARVVALAKDADVLFIEAAFLQEDCARAAERRHLTAHQAGTLARLANVKRVVTLHYSPRYQGHGERLAREAEAAFRGG